MQRNIARVNYTFPSDCGGPVIADTRVVWAHQALALGDRDTVFERFQVPFNDYRSTGMPGRLFWEGEAITRPLLELASERGADLTWLDSMDRRVLTLTEAGAAPAPELRIPLSPREVEVLQLIAAGHSNPKIAARLYISRTLSSATS